MSLLQNFIKLGIFCCVLFGILLPAVNFSQCEANGLYTEANRSFVESITEKLRFRPLCFINTIDPPEATDFTRPVSYRIYSRDLLSLKDQILATHFSRITLQGSEYLSVTTGQQSHSDITRQDRHVSPSFVIDYNEPIFQAIRQEVEAVYGQKPSLTDLANFTNQHIDEKSSNMLRFASVIAKEKFGDCKEHAIFATALARMFGYRSRVIIGYVLVGDGGKWVFVGHAWSEAYDEKTGKWLGLDGTKIKPRVDNSYIPIMELENEGPSYNMTLLKFLQIGIKRMEIEE